MPSIRQATVAPVQLASPSPNGLAQGGTRISQRKDVRHLFPSPCRLQPPCCPRSMGPNLPTFRTECTVPRAPFPTVTMTAGRGQAQSSSSASNERNTLVASMTYFPPFLFSRKGKIIIQFFSLPILLESQIGGAHFGISVRATTQNFLADLFPPPCPSKAFASTNTGRQALFFFFSLSSFSSLCLAGDHPKDFTLLRYL